MDTLEATLVLTTFLFAALLKGVTGLGFSTICLPILAMFLDPKTCIPLTILPSLMSNALIMQQTRRFKTALGRFWLLYLSAAPGLYAGVLVLRSVDSAVSRNTLGVVLVLYAIWAYRMTALGLPQVWESRLKVPVGVCTGLINGMTGSQVMPVLPFLLSLRMDKETFVHAINLSFTFSSILMLVFLNRIGLLNPPLVGLSTAGVIPVAAGVYLGGKLRRSMQEDTYRRGVLLFLLMIGIFLLLRP